MDSSYAVKLTKIDNHADVDDGSGRTNPLKLSIFRISEHYLIGIRNK